MKVPLRIACLMFLFLLVIPKSGDAAIMGQVSHFPTTSSSSWVYAGSGLTTDRSGNQVTQPFTETVTSNGGVFHSQIDFSGGNTTTSDNFYLQEDALYIGSTRIVMVSKMDSPAGEIQTTTTSNNSYSPPQEYFPSELFAGNVETSNSSCTTNITTTVVAMGHSSSSSTSTSSSQNMRITVSGSEQVTTGAGTFQTVVLSKEITINEEGNTSTYTTTEWYAEGIGLVKFHSANMNRDLVSYAVNPFEPSDVQISGNPGNFGSLQEALNAAGNGTVIQAKSTTIQGAIALGNPVDVSLSGGWDGTFDTLSGVTTIHGSLTIEKGSMEVTYLVIS